MNTKDFENEQIPQEKKKSGADAVLDYVLEILDAIVIAVFAMIVLFTFLIRIITVSGPSMNNTLHDKDVLLLSSFAYEPEKGDIVVVESSAFGDTIIKRIIATEGQTVDIDYDAEGGCKVYVDGEVITEDYIAEPMLEMQGYSKSFYDAENTVYHYEVPRGNVFVMGDNRNVSSDSRTIGFVDEDEIVGKVVFRMYSQSGSIGKVK